MSRLIFLALVSITLAVTVASADTIIPGGSVSGTWDAAGSPYIVQGDITITSRQSLIIDPGVEVIFQGHYKLNVEGILEAVGTATDSIFFTTASALTGWEGIWFTNESDSSRCGYCKFTYGKAIYYSSGQTGGGAIYCYRSNPSIYRCNFWYNESVSGYGGAVFLLEASPSIDGCVFVWNEATSSTGMGGALYGKYTEAVISDNIFCDNAAGGAMSYGGALAFENSNPVMVDNFIVDNSAGGYLFQEGGGIYLSSSSPVLENCVIAYNESNTGSAIYAYPSCYPVIHNTIIWGNSIYAGGGSSPVVTWSDIQGGWSGTGNIATDPMFIDPAYWDFRLLWESPCIDAGDPDPQYLDPDSTRADMGIYYDQSVPVRVTLTCFASSILHRIIPAGGGDIDYSILFTNIDPTNPMFETWVDVTLPNGSTFGPIVGPLAWQLEYGSSLSRQRVQSVPGGAPAGLFSYNAYAVVGTDTSFDSFPFVKLESNGAVCLSDWFISGETFEGIDRESIPVQHSPLEFSLEPNYPNPFNPTTTISFTLSSSMRVNLSVYDISGRLAEVVVNDWRDAGVHYVMFDGSGLASGVYLYRLKADDFRTSGKMLLIK